MVLEAHTKLVLRERAATAGTDRPVEVASAHDGWAGDEGSWRGGYAWWWRTDCCGSMIGFRVRGSRRLLLWARYDGVARMVMGSGWY